MSEPQKLCSVQTLPGHRCVREEGHADAHLILSDKEQMEAIARERVCSKCGTKGANGLSGKEFCSTCGAEP